MMSNIEMAMNQRYDKQKKHVTTNGKWFISTNDTWDRGWETMVFARNSATGNVEFGAEIDINHYNDEEEAYQGHEEMIKKWEAR